MIDIAITGAAGRMGQRLVALAKQDGGLQIVGATERAGHEAIGRDAGEVAGIGGIGVPITTELTGAPKVVVDFTTPAATRQWLRVCREKGFAILIGTTGLEAADHAEIDAAAKEIPVLQSPTMALGVAVLFKVAGEVARMLGEDYDIEIVEAHHRFKKDAPSGTAMGLADAILKATGKMRESLVYGRNGGDCQREPGKVTMHSLRMGDEVGSHTAFFGALGERLELTHKATNRDTFVWGALRATMWLAGQKPGRYTLSDVLGF